MTATSATQQRSEQATDKNAIRPFHVNVPEADLADLRRRLAATRWPDKETVADRSQGAQLAKLQELVRYWGTDYDWRKAEAKLNAFPQFMTTIDGVDIHFIHVRSRHPNALPLIITHGWPGSVFEQIKLIGPLTDPTAFGGRAEDAFDVVIPSLPGFGFSSRPTEAGWGLERIGRAWDVLMKRLGYTRYVAQGGDWGAGVVQAMGRQAPAGLLGIHTNLPAVVTERRRCGARRRARAGGTLRAGTRGIRRPESVPPERGLGLPDDDERAAAGRRLRPDGLPRRPRGVDARARRVREVDATARTRKQSPTRDEVLDNFSLYWLTNTAASAARFYWENRGPRPDQCGRAEDRRDLGPGGHHGVSGRGLSRPGDMGPARLPQPDLLQRRRPGRPLRGVGAPGTVFRANSVPRSDRCGTRKHVQHEPGRTP